MITPHALADALPRHRTIAAACKALGTSRQAVYGKRTDGSYVHPDLVTVCQVYAASRKIPRAATGKAGEHRLTIPVAVTRRLTDVATERAVASGGTRPRRSELAREVLYAALRGPLPPPVPPSGQALTLDLGPAWTAVERRVGADVGGHVRAILIAWAQSGDGA